MVLFFSRNAYLINLCLIVNLLIGYTIPLIGKQGYKIVGLVYVRNEEIFIEQCLKALACYTDAMVIIDDASEDNTLKIIKKLAKKLHIEKIIEHKESVLQTKGERYNHQELLDEGRKIGGTHFIMLDADEMFTSLCKKDNWLRKKILSLKKGQAMAFPMVNVWGSAYYYRDDADCNPYQDRWKGVTAVLCDDGVCNYMENSVHGIGGFIHVPRDPGNRICQENAVVSDINYGLIHFKHVNFNNIPIKKAWYMCLEYIQSMQRSPDLSQQHANNVNRRYNGYEFKGYLPGDPEIILKKVPNSWYQGYKFFNEKQLAQENVTRKNDILRWIKQYGPTYFAPLDIWNIPWIKAAVSL